MLELCILPENGSSLLPDLLQDQDIFILVLHLKFTPFSILAFGCSKGVEVCLYAEFFLPSSVSIS